MLQPLSEAVREAICAAEEWCDSKIIGAKRPGKCALTLYSGIVVTKRVKLTNRTNQSRRTPLLHTEFEAI